MERTLLPPPVWDNALSPSDDEQTFRTLLRNSQAMCAETDVRMLHLEHTRAPVCGGKFRKWEVKLNHRSPSNSAVVLQMVDCDDVPFRRSLVVEAMRRLFKQTRGPDAQQAGNQVSSYQECVV